MSDIVTHKARTAGIVVGVATFVSVGLFMVSGADRRPAEHLLASAAPPEEVIAPAEQLGKAFAAVAARIKPAVVSVYSEHMITVRRPAFPFPFGDEFFAPFFGPQFPPPRPPAEPKEYKIPQRGLGSGMILDKEGHILTNYHVVKDVEQIRCSLPISAPLRRKSSGAT